MFLSISTGNLERNFYLFSLLSTFFIFAFNTILLFNDRQTRLRYGFQSATTRRQYPFTHENGWYKLVCEMRHNIEFEYFLRRQMKSEGEKYKTTLFRVQYWTVKIVGIILSNNGKTGQVNDKQTNTTLNL